MMPTARLAILLTLAACSSPEPPAAPVEKAKAEPIAAAAPVAQSVPAKATPTLLLDSGGLILNGTLLRFGIPRADAERAVSKIQGKSLNQGSSDECGAGLVAYTGYRDDLQLAFQEDKFSGWTINGAASPLRTAKGIGIGSPRQSLDAAYPDVLVDDSSLGLLFSTGDLVGLLDQDGIEGIVTDIWAGTVCLVD